ncbi:MAG: deoxyribose-phosphate aldolase [Candidatus Dadabacteria bacterium]|nr:MAG: deoxyribose-phosphate aldolase [Candidatus Dadabacteria bacterium]
MPVPVDAVGVEERAHRFSRRSIKEKSKEQALLLALSMVDLTTLEGCDTPAKVRQLCAKAVSPGGSCFGGVLSDVPHVAAVCVYPSLVKTAKKALEGTGVKVASVATSFPSGQSPLDVRLKEVRYCVEEGADEIDMVISRGRFLAGDFSYVSDEISQVKEACGSAHLKVILETGELGSLDNVRAASDLAIRAGADFIKTSTGKIKSAASMEVVLVMLEAVRDYYLETGRKIGVKPAGGISTAKQAIHYLVMLKETLGKEWLTRDLFRFGASRLTNDLLMQLAKCRSGVYQSGDYFPVA